ncbi:DUF2798 domain-containing protein [Pasteurellaceae bacterium USgator11]|nr:DUF2798 domain-containing protein [Pasteurellaceae bacterium USgator41]TNG95863.1 DUF2798 domain-containing protein [Pasteurellaceae bacterium UScroc12]TNG98969.1 DUF2798 domain-containing protein [Pasteurellaceae bacterium UScroc31]TNG99718.1 DUF2798 domain-containing protein [Pasteurellaceae bacterium USgator11]
MKGFIPAKYTALVTMIYMAALMGFVLSVVVVAINTGVGDGYVGRVVSSYFKVLPMSIISVIVIRPLALKLVRLTIWQDEQEA